MTYLKRTVLLLFALITLPTLVAEVGGPDFPSDVFSFFDEWRITLGDGSTVNNLIGYENPDYFFTAFSEEENWVVYKTPNSGGTTANSSNTRAELRHVPEWLPSVGGRMTGTLKVQNVSVTGDARVASAFSVVIGQIHSNQGHENEPLKIFYKKFPGHTKGSVFWNYEINTEGSNTKRWDLSTPVWGYDYSVLGSDENTPPAEPEDGIELGETFSYDVNVVEGTMHLTFESEGHDTKTFSKSLIASEYINFSDVPEQVLTVFATTGQDGTEKASAYAGERQYFKQGSYNQSNAKDPAENIVWNAGSDSNNGDLDAQYANGNYAEVWFKEASVVVNEATVPSGIENENAEDFMLYPNPANRFVQVSLGDQSITNVKLFNAAGQCLIQQNAISNTAIQLDLNNIESGLYFLVIEDEFKRYNLGKLIKQ